MTVQLERFNEVQKRFADIEKKLNDTPADFKEDVGEILLSDVHQTFATEGYGDWPKHAPGTKRGIGILQKTGKSLEAIGIRPGKNQVERFMPRSKYWMTFHEKGTGGMPKREFMTQLADASWQLILEAGKKHLLR